MEGRPPLSLSLLFHSLSLGHSSVATKIPRQRPYPFRRPNVSARPDIIARSFGYIRSAQVDSLRLSHERRERQACIGIERSERWDAPAWQEPARSQIKRKLINGETIARRMDTCRYVKRGPIKLCRYHALRIARKRIYELKLYLDYISIILSRGSRRCSRRYASRFRSRASTCRDRRVKNRVTDDIKAHRRGRLAHVTCPAERLFCFGLACP